MLEAGKKAPDFELPDQDGVMHKLSDYAGKKVIFIFFIQRITHQDVRNRHAVFQRDIRSLRKRVRSFLESVKIPWLLIRDLKKNMVWHLHF